MPQYAILIFDEELPGGVEDMPQEILDAHMAVGDRITALGARTVSAYALQSAATSTTIRTGGILTDGPFLETKEALAGFFVVEAPNLDVALAIGRAVPTINGAVEVRPLLDAEPPASFDVDADAAE